MRLHHGRWQVRYRDPAGRSRAKSFDRKTDAKRFREELIVERRRGAWIDPKRGDVTLRTFWLSWRAESIETTRLQPTTLAKYDRTWRLYVEPVIGAIPLSRITRKLVNDMVDRASARSSPWQAAEALKLTRRLLNAALDDERIARNVAARIPMPQGERKPITILSPEQLHAAVAHLPERYRALALLAAYSSLRWSELVAVKRDDLDLEHRTVRVDERATEVGGGGGPFAWGRPKTAGSRRVVDLPRLVIRPLAEHLLKFPPLRSDEAHLDGLVFHSPEGGVMRRHLFRRVWSQASVTAGVPTIRLEHLRHTGASLAYAASKDMKAVAARLGHTSTRMIDTVYVELYADAGRNLAAAIDILVEERLAADVDEMWTNGAAQSPTPLRGGGQDGR
jgi:integrase